MIIFINAVLRKNIIFGYESIGKKVMGLKIYDENEKRIKNNKILMDRVYYSLPTFHIYMFMILANNKSTGDKKMKTTVK